MAGYFAGLLKICLQCSKSQRAYLRPLVFIFDKTFDQSIHWKNKESFLVVILTKPNVSHSYLFQLFRFLVWKSIQM